MAGVPDTVCTGVPCTYVCDTMAVDRQGTPEVHPICTRHTMGGYYIQCALLKLSFPFVFTSYE